MIKVLKIIAIILIIIELGATIIVEEALPLLGLVFLQVIILVAFAEDDDL